MVKTISAFSTYFPAQVSESADLSIKIWGMEYVGKYRGEMISYSSVVRN